MQLDRRLIALALGLVVSGSASAVLPPKYVATPIPSLNPSLGFYPKSINLSGTVVGVGFNAFGQNQPQIWSGGGASSLGTLGGSYANAYGINDAGEVVGNSQTAGGNWHAFKYTGGMMTDLGTLGDPTWGSIAQAINKFGVVAGAAIGPGGETRAVFWDATGIHDCGLPKNSDYAYATAINNGGKIAGECAIDKTGTAHAFVWWNGKFKILVDKNFSSSARGINNKGHVTGIYSTATDGNHAFFYNGTTITDLGTLGGHYSLGWGINAYDDIVGTTRDASSSDRAFVWTGGVMYDLNNALTAPLAIPLVQASAINNKGTIVAYDFFNNAYRLTRVQ